MEKIILPMKVHAVKLEYRRLLLEQMTHGYFSVKQGKNIVVITHDPKAQKYSPKRPRVLRDTSRTGKLYIDSINSYLKVKAEYDILLNAWKTAYRFAPPRVRFPIVQFYDPHCMNNEYYNKQKSNLGKYISDNPTHSDHGDLKSKNELMGSDVLKQIDIPFKYETVLNIPEADETINPDYLASFYEIDRCIYIELCGMNDKDTYSARTATKINSYAKGRYRQGREVIFIHLYDKYNFDGVVFAELVLSAFNTMIPDSALEWGTDLYSIPISS